MDLLMIPGNRRRPAAASNVSAMLKMSDGTKSSSSQRHKIKNPVFQRNGYRGALSKDWRFFVSRVVTQWAAALETGSKQLLRVLFQPRVKVKLALLYFDISHTFHLTSAVFTAFSAPPSLISINMVQSLNKSNYFWKFLASDIKYLWTSIVLENCVLTFQDLFYTLTQCLNIKVSLIFTNWCSQC